MEGDSKTICDQLSKGFSNVLRRKNKKSGSGAGEEREWKFEKELMFLLPFKQSRATASNFECERNSDEETFNNTSSESVNTPKPKRLKVNRSTTDEDAILQMLKKRQEEKSKESPRLGFFKSLMKSVDSLSESEFMGLQMDFIQALQARTNNQNSASTSVPQQSYHHEEEYPYAGTSSLFEL